MASQSFFGNGSVGQDPWALRGENDGRIRSLETRALGLATSGVGLADTNFTPANTWINWGSALSIPKPNVAVSITVLLTGYLADFTAIAVAFTRVGISFDGGGSYTYGNTPRTVAGQGGSNYNSQAIAASFFRSGTPTGDVLVQAQGNSNITTTSGVMGTLTYVMVPI